MNGKKVVVAFAVEDINPVTPGHTIVILNTEKPVPTWFHASPREREWVMEVVDRVRVNLEGKYHPDGFSIVMNCGEHAGQTVPQLHVHVVPQYKTYPLVMLPGPKQEPLTVNR